MFDMDEYLKKLKASPLAAPDPEAEKLERWEREKQEVFRCFSSHVLSDVQKLNNACRQKGRAEAVTCKSSESFLRITSSLFPGAEADIRLTETGVHCIILSPGKPDLTAAFSFEVRDDGYPVLTDREPGAKWCRDLDAEALCRYVLGAMLPEPVSGPHTERSGPIREV